jgi:1,2-diacylglycerol-3-alpha-glucose alpha-1,2-glucosyltransferase
LKVKFLVTPVGLMMGNIESARRLKKALGDLGVSVVDDRHAQGFDVLHVHTPVPPSNMTEVKRARRRGIPVVIHAHTTAEDSQGTWTGSTALSGVTGMYLTHFYNLGSLVLAPSAWTKSTLEKRGVRVPIEVLSNGIDLDRFRFDQERRKRFRTRYGIPERSKVVYSIGVVCIKKGIEDFPRVAEVLPDMTFVWIGRRSMLYHPIRVRIAMTRSPGNARFLHDVDDIADAHSGCDIFFTPSFTENQGMAVMEAMAMGRPVVARDLPSYSGLLENEKDALLCSDASCFASSISRISQDQSLAESLVGQGYPRLAEHEMPKVAKRLIGIYESLLEHRPRQEASGA